MSAALPPFACPVCGATSAVEDDVRRGYCPACRAFTGVTLPGVGAGGEA